MKLCGCDSLLPGLEVGAYSCRARMGSSFNRPSAARSSPKMDKREFLKLSGAIVAGSIASRFASGQPGSQPHAKQPAPHENWAGNIHYSTDHVHTPANLEEVQE